MAAKTLYDIVMEKLRRGEVSIGVNKGYSLATYAKVTKNPLVKLFHFMAYLYTHPFIIIGVVIALVYYEKYPWIFYYLISIFLLLLIEGFVHEQVAITTSVTDRHTFDELHRRGVIKIKEKPKEGSKSKIRYR